MINNTTAMDYETDFYAWLMHNAKLLKEGVLSDIDRENIAEELEAMGRSERNQLVNRLTVLIMHLLKWQYPPNRQSKSWRSTIREQRKRLKRLLKQSPCLNYLRNEHIADAYDIAISAASAETGLDESNFPNLCPFTWEQIMDDSFFPPDENKYQN